MRQVIEVEDIINAINDGDIRFRDLVAALEAWADVNIPNHNQHDFHAKIKELIRIANAQ